MTLLSRNHTKKLFQNQQQGLSLNHSNHEKKKITNIVIILWLYLGRKRIIQLLIPQIFFGALNPNSSGNLFVGFYRIVSEFFVQLFLIYSEKLSRIS